MLEPCDGRSRTARVQRDEEEERGRERSARASIEKESKKKREIRLEEDRRVAEDGASPRDGQRDPERQECGPKRGREGRCEEKSRGGDDSNAAR